MNKLYLSFAILLSSFQLNAQNYSLKDLESSFIQNNAILLANRFNIDKIDAQIIQEKLWNNPTLSISEVNLWKTYNVEQQPNLIGNFGKNQQISVELEQLIETAGKRKKRVALKTLEKNEAQFEYEEIFRELRKEVRINFHQIHRIVQQENQLKQLIDLFEILNNQYESQANKQNVTKADFYRIQTELIHLNQEMISLQSDKIETINQLITLTHLKDLNEKNLQFEEITTDLCHKIPVNFSDNLKQQNIAIKRLENEIEKNNQTLVLEKALRTPDLRMQVNYDRGGNIMRDFVGVGVSFDLPIFNTNKGNIKAAEIELTKSKHSENALVYSLEMKANQLIQQLNLYEKTLKNWSNYQTDDRVQIVKNYQKQLQNKQVTLLEFIDFTQAYRETQDTYNALQENYMKTWEELQYITGIDL